MPIWYYDKRTLRATPTALSGIDMETEHRYRREGARFIINTGTKLGLHYDTIATGVVYFHRFYMFHSFKDFPRYVTACCCLFLAGKVEETPKKCKDVIKTARSLLTDQQFIQFGEDPREEIMVLERILLKVIKFDLQVEHPYSYLLKYAKCLKGDRVKLQKMVQSAWTFVNDSLCTTLCLQWEPEIIAIALMYLAGKLSKFEVTDWAGKHSRQRRWWEVYVEDITVELLEDICHQVLDLYSTPASKVESPPASPPSKTPMRTSTSSLVLQGLQLLRISSNGIPASNPVQTNPFTLPVVTHRNELQPIGGQQIPSIGFQQAIPTIKLAKMESQPTTPKSALLTPTELSVQSMPLLGDGSSLSRTQSPHHPQLQPKHHLVDDLQAFLTSGIPLPPSSTGYGANTYLTPGNGEAMSHQQQYMDRASAHQQQGQMSSANPLYKTSSMQSSSQAVYETQSYQGSFATPPPPPPSNQYYHQHQHPGMRSASYQASLHPPQMSPFSQEHQQQHLVQSNQMAYGHLPPPPPPPPMMGNPNANVNYAMGYPGGIVVRPPPPPPSGQRRQW